MKQRNIQLYRMAKNAISNALYKAKMAFDESTKFDSVLSNVRNSSYFKNFIVTEVQRKRVKIYTAHM
jgi:hypothetical protein